MARIDRLNPTTGGWKGCDPSSGPGAVCSILGYDRPNGRFEGCGLIDTGEDLTPVGVDFPLGTDEGYLISAPGDGSHPQPGCAD